MFLSLRRIERGFLGIMYRVIKVRLEMKNKNKIDLMEKYIFNNVIFYKFLLL